MTLSLKRKANKYLLLSFLHFLQYFQLNGLLHFYEQFVFRGEKKEKSFAVS